MRNILKQYAVAATILVIASAVLPAVSICPADECEKARQFYMKGAYEKAEKAWRDLLKTDAAVTAAVGLAETLDMTGRYAEAVATLATVTKKGDTNPDWNIACAGALARVGRYRDALKKADRALDLAPASAPAILIKGRLLEILGDKDTARETYRLMEKTVEKEEYHTDAEALVALGRILDRYAVLTRRRASEQAPNILHNYFQEAYQKVDSRYWPANLAAAEFLLSKHKARAAMEELALAAKINKHLPDVHAMRAAVLLGQWKFEECGTEADKALAVNPRHDVALYMKAACLMQWRKFEEVPAILEKIFAYNPNHVEALSLAAAACIRIGEDGKAQAFCARVEKINPKSAILPQTIGQWLTSGRLYEQAEPYLLTAEQRAPEKAGPPASLGKLYMETGEEDKALVYLEKARRLDDYRADVVNYLNTARKLKDFEIRETEHFIIKADTPDAVMLKLVGDYMEAVYPEVTGDYGWEPKDKTIIEIMPTQKDFSARIAGRGWIPTVGACTGRVIAIATPNKARGSLGLHNWTEVLRHEFAHTVTLGMTGNRIPHWFTEACSVWQQKDKRAFNYVKTLVAATQYDRLFPLAELNWGFIRPKRPGDRKLAYAQSEWILECIIETYGFETVRDMLKAFGKGHGQEKIFKDILNIDEKTFDEHFRRWAAETVTEWGYDPTKPPKVSETAGRLREDPENPARLAEHAKALFFGRKLKQAKDCAEKTLKRDEDNTTALRLLARIHLMNKHYEQAIATCRRIEEVTPTTRTAPDVLAECYLRMDKRHPDRYLAEAIAALELLQKRAPLNSKSYTKLADIYLKIGAPEKALPNLIYLHRHSMNDQKYARQIAEIYRSMDRMDMALKYFMEVIYTNSFEINAYESIASILVRQGQFRDAVATAEQMTLIDPRSPRVHSYNAKILYRAGKAAGDAALLEKARNEVLKALELGSPPAEVKRIQHYIDATLKKLKAGAETHGHERNT